MTFFSLLSRLARLVPVLFAILSIILWLIVRFF
jgi:hypothetical protein